MISSLGRGSDEAMVTSTIEMNSMRLEQDHCGEVRIAGVAVTLYLTP